jgi:gag-polypeptide of LTR copia-type
MWKVIKDDATSKSMLYLLDAEDQLSSMKLAKNNDPKTHLSELKHHFQLMLQRRDNLIKIGSEMSESHFITLIMLSLPQSYQPTIQTITTNKRASKLSGLQSSSMEADDLIAFILEEAQHRVINNERSRDAKSALAAHTKSWQSLKERKRKRVSQILHAKTAKGLAMENLIATRNEVAKKGKPHGIKSQMQRQKIPKRLSWLLMTKTMNCLLLHVRPIMQL